MPLSCGAAPGISHFFLPGDSASNLTIESKGLTEAIQSQRTLPWTKGGGGINCRKLGKRICPSGNVSSESGVWTEASRKVQAAASFSSHLHSISGLVVQVSPGWNERKGICKASERPSLPHYTLALRWLKAPTRFKIPHLLLFGNQCPFSPLTYPCPDRLKPCYFFYKCSSLCNSF